MIDVFSCDVQGNGTKKELSAMQADPVSPRNADLRDLTGDDPHVQLLLTLARTHLGMEVAWLSTFTADQQVSRGADGSVAAMNVPVREGTDLPARSAPACSPASCGRGSTTPAATRSPANCRSPPNSPSSVAGSG